MTAVTPVEVFYSYAHEDVSWLQKLDRHLAVLKRRGLISVWDNRLVVPGTDWAQAIANHLDSASLILLLISPHFMNSDRCYNEMQHALKRQAAKEALVIPIRLRPVARWESLPFAHLQALPREDQFISELSPRKEDKVLASIVDGIRLALAELPFLRLNQTPLSQLAWNASFVDSQIPEFPNSHVWPRYSLGDLLREPPQRGLWLRPSNSSTGFPVLRINAITSRHDFIVEEQDFEYLELSEPEKNKYEIKSGDLLVCSSHVDPTFVGRFALYQGYSSQVQSYFDPLIRFRIDTNRVLSNFACAVLNSPITRKYIQSFLTGTTARTRISIGNLKKILIPTPPLSEQLRVVVYLDDLQAQIDKLKREQDKVVAELDALLPPILDRTFKEEL
jgi:hypothetical protein